MLDYSWSSTRILLFLTIAQNSGKTPGPNIRRFDYAVTCEALEVLILRILTAAGAATIAFFNKKSNIEDGRRTALVSHGNV